MGYIPPDMRDGDELAIEDINAERAELRRWNKLSARGNIRVLNANNDHPPIIEGIFPKPFTIRLTDVGDANGYHKWEEVYYGPDANGTYTLVTTGCMSDNNTIIDQARELNGLRCPKSDHVYHAWRDVQGVVTFEAVRTFGVSGASIAANSSGSVYLWSLYNGTQTNSNTSITAYNWNNANSVASGVRVMLTPYCGRWWVDFETCS